MAPICSLSWSALNTAVVFLWVPYSLSDFLSTFLENHSGILPSFYIFTEFFSIQVSPQEFKHLNTKSQPLLICLVFKSCSSSCGQKRQPWAFALHHHPSFPLLCAAISSAPCRAQWMPGHKGGLCAHTGWAQTGHCFPGPTGALGRGIPGRDKSNYSHFVLGCNI